MIDAVAHCAVAILTIPSIEGSASATAAGVIAEFRAVVPIAAPIAFLSFFGRRRLITKKKITAVAAEISPSTIPEAPAVRIVLTSVFAPIEIVMKNVTIGCAVLHASRNPLSRFPQKNPISSGTNTAIRDLIGIFASPVAPSAISVKNGPSFSDRIEIAPVSVAFPNCEEREMYSDPFEFVIAAINTNGAIPRNPCGPQILPTIRPTITPSKNLVPVIITPL